MLRNYLRLNLSLLYWVFVAPFTGQFFKISPIFRQMVFIGTRATSMVALTAFSIGVTLALQAANALQNMGAGAAQTCVLIAARAHSVVQRSAPRREVG